MPSIKTTTYRAIGIPESGSNANLPGVPPGTEVTVTWEEKPRPIVYRGSVSMGAWALEVMTDDAFVIWPAPQADYERHGFKTGQRVEVRITPVED